MPLNKQQIRELIETKGLIRDYVDLDLQIQPAGFDISLGEVFRYGGRGTIDFDNSKREIPDPIPVPKVKWDITGEDYWILPKGAYLTEYAEVVKMPLDIVAIARPRSSLVRNGATFDTGVWDPGYEGRGRQILIVSNPEGIKLFHRARIFQLVFFNIDEVEEGYNGKYQRENVNEKKEN